MDTSNSMNVSVFSAVVVVVAIWGRNDTASSLEVTLWMNIKSVGRAFDCLKDTSASRITESSGTEILGNASTGLLDDSVFR